MSVTEYRATIRHAREAMASAPTVWAIMANSVRDRYEVLTPVAMFDSEASAWAYVAASRLPGGGGVRTTEPPHGYFRSHRPDSLLWDFNPIESGDYPRGGVVRVNEPITGWDTIPANPAPPSGPLTPGDFPGLAYEYADTIWAMFRE